MVNNQINNFWYVVYTKSAKEQVAVENLKNQNYSVQVPLYKSIKMVRNKWVEKIEPMFPRYLFIKPQSEEHSIRSARYTMGVQKLVGFGDQLATISNNDLQLIIDFSNKQNQADFDEINPIHSGDKVEIFSGTLKGMDGIVSKVANERVDVLITLLGKQQTVNINNDQLKLLSS